MDTQVQDRDFGTNQWATNIFDNGVVCEHDGTTEKYVKGGRCVACRKRYEVKYRAEKREERNAYYRWYSGDNRDRSRAYARARAEAEKTQTPSHFCRETSLQIFKKASAMSQEFEDDYHVDHLYPLRGTWCSGLNTPDNYIILTAFDNMSKGNRRYDKYHGVIGTLLEKPYKVVFP